jgi:hypothetical protein
LDFVGLCWTLLDFVGLCWTLLDFVGLCWTFLDYAGVCWKKAKKLPEVKSLLGAIQIIRDTLGGRGGMAKMSHDNFYW